MKRNLQKGILVTSACAAFLLGNVQQAYAVAADAIEIVQQNKKIAGTVVDQNGEAVIGANVIQKGTTNGTITDIDGKFTLEVPAKAVLTRQFYRISIARGSFKRKRNPTYGYAQR